MFSRLFRKKSGPNDHPEVSNYRKRIRHVISKHPYHLSGQAQENFPVKVVTKVISVKGFPFNSSCVLFHPNKAVLVCGTHGSGSLYCTAMNAETYLDRLGSPSECEPFPLLPSSPRASLDCNILFMLPIYPDKIMVALEDDSILLITVPHLVIIDRLSSDWLSLEEGSITCWTNDIVRESPFVYVGTSTGYVKVIEIVQHSFESGASSTMNVSQEASTSKMKVCPFYLNSNDMGVNQIVMESVGKVYSSSPDTLGKNGHTSMKSAGLSSSSSGSIFSRNRSQSLSSKPPSMWNGAARLFSSSIDNERHIFSVVALSSQAKDEKYLAIGLSICEDDENLMNINSSGKLSKTIRTPSGLVVDSEDQSVDGLSCGGGYVDLDCEMADDNQHVGVLRGAVVIYNLKRQRVSRLVRCDAVASLCWNLSGDVLYIGTCCGQLLAMDLEKKKTCLAWEVAQDDLLLEGFDNQSGDLGGGVCGQRRSGLSNEEDSLLELQGVLEKEDMKEEHVFSSHMEDSSAGRKNIINRGLRYRRRPENEVILSSLLWLPPQTGRGALDSGGLCVILRHKHHSQENLKGALVTLIPDALHRMKLVYQLPPFCGELLTNITLVPLRLRDAGLHDHGESSFRSKNFLHRGVAPAWSYSPSTSQRMPGLILLSHPDSGTSSTASFVPDSVMRLMKLPRASLPNWLLEIGRPQQIRELEPPTFSRNTITEFKGLMLVKKRNLDGSYGNIKSCGNLLSKVLLQEKHCSRGDVCRPVYGITEDLAERHFTLDGISRGLLSEGLSDGSTRNVRSTVITEDLPESIEKWGIYLANEIVVPNEKIKDLADVVVFGHKNGTVRMFTVAVQWMPYKEIHGCGDLFQLEHEFSIGSNPVMIIEMDNDAGIIFATDNIGTLHLREVYDDNLGIGVLESLRSNYAQLVDQAENLASKTLSVSDFLPDAEQLEINGKISVTTTDSVPAPSRTTSGKLFPNYGGKRVPQYNTTRAIYSTRLIIGCELGPVSAVCLRGHALSLWVGTYGGFLAFSEDTQFETGEFQLIQHIEQTGASGAVTGLNYGYYVDPNGELITAIYAIFRSGHLLVIDFVTKSILAVNSYIHDNFPLNTTDLSETPSLNNRIYLNTEMPILNEKGIPVPLPTVLGTLYAHERRTIIDSMLSNSPESGEDTHSKSITPQKDVIHRSQKKSPGLLKRLLHKTEDENPSDTARKTFSILRYTSDEAPSRIMPILCQSIFSIDMAELQSSSSMSSNYKSKDGVTCLDLSKQKIITSSILTYEPDPNFFTQLASGEIVPINRPKDEADEFQSLLPTGTDFHSPNSNEENSDSNQKHEDEIKQESVKKNQFHEHCLAVITDVGEQFIISLRTFEVISRLPLLAAVVNRPSDTRVNLGFIFTNGVSVSIFEHSRQYCATQFEIEGYIPHQNKPLSFYTRLADPNPHITLLHGREDQLDAEEEIIRNRKCPITRLTTHSPTDLHKYFSKSPDQLRRRKLLFSTSRKIHQSKEDSTNKSPTSSAKKHLSGMAQQKSEDNRDTLNEVGRQLQERGEKISRISMGAANLQGQAADFRAVAAEKRKALEQQNSRWSIF